MMDLRLENFSSKNVDSIVLMMSRNSINVLGWLPFNTTRVVLITTIESYDAIHHRRVIESHFLIVANFLFLTFDKKIVIS